VYDAPKGKHALHISDIAHFQLQEIRLNEKLLGIDESVRDFLLEVDESARDFMLHRRNDLRQR
jgi:hypothetical protein